MYMTECAAVPALRGSIGGKMDDPGATPTAEIRYGHVAGLRPLTERDVPRVVELYHQAYGGERVIDAQEILSWIANPEIERTALAVLERDGVVVGYGDLTVAEGVVALEVAAPGEWATFLEWAEQTCALNGYSRVRVLSYASTELPEAAAARGYHLWRSSYTMEISFEEVTPVVSPLPEGLRLCAYDGSQDEPLRSALNDVFAPDPFFHQLTSAQFREHYVHARAMDPTLWTLAWAGKEIAGFVLAFPEYYGDATSGFIHELGVRPAWHGHGLGQALITHAFRQLHARGLRMVRLGVDGSNESAVRLYERVGMHATQSADNWVLDVDTKPEAGPDASAKT